MEELLNFENHIYKKYNRKELNAEQFHLLTKEIQSFIDKRCEEAIGTPKATNNSEVKG